MPAAVVFAAAPLQPTPRLVVRLSELHRPTVIAADDGATTALSFGLQPDVVIGDLDSLLPSTLLRLEQAGVPIESHPRDKDQTDGQLAIERALDSKPTELLLLGFLGPPRLDQWLANILLLTKVAARAVLLDDRNECLLLRPGALETWRPEPNEIISLIPLSADVGGITTRGLRWPLNGERLRLGETRGVSNEPVTPEVSLSIDEGLLLVTRHFAR